MPVDPRFYRSSGPKTAADIAELIGGAIRGEPLRPVSGLAPAADAGPDDLCFIDDAASAADVSADAGLVLATEAAMDRLPSGVDAVLTAAPRLAFARAAAALFEERRLDGQEDAISSEAAIHKTAVLGPGVVVGPGAAIGEGAVIGPGTVIGPGVQIGRYTRIGPHASLSAALIGDRVTLLAGVRIGEAGFGLAVGDAGPVDVPHFGRAIVQDNVSIGANSCVDRGALGDTVIGEGAKIDNLCHIAHNCQIGRGVVMAAFAGISGSVVMDDFVQCGGRVGIADHAHIGAGARIAASAGLWRDVPAGETWGGIPAKPMKQWMREIAWTAKQIKPKARR